MNTSTHIRCRGRGGISQVRGVEEKQSERDYFDSYTRTSIHRDMIMDRVRTEAYRRAIMHNKHLLKDKIVLDVGCGTGILTLLAAKAGAKKVYGVDMSDFSYLAGQNVLKNGYHDKVDIIKGKMEEVVLQETASSSQGTNG